MTKIVPNTFQTFNDYVDRALQYLTGEETKCLLFATRHIMGWQDRIDARTAAISLTMFQRGYTTKDGKEYGGTGLSRPAIVKAVGALVDFGLLEKEGEADNSGQQWKIGHTPDYAKMEARQAEQGAAQQRRTVVARQVRKAKSEGGKSDKPPLQVVNGTNHQRLVGQTTSGKSDKLNQSHLQNHSQSQLEKPRIIKGKRLTLTAQVKATPQWTAFEAGHDGITPSLRSYDAQKTLDAIAEMEGNPDFCAENIEGLTRSRLNDPKRTTPYRLHYVLEDMGDYLLSKRNSNNRPELQPYTPPPPDDEPPLSEEERRRLFAEGKRAVLLALARGSQDERLAG